MKVITYEDRKEINRLYAELHTYAAVARAMGISPSTVKKYVTTTATSTVVKPREVFDKPLPEFDPTIFRTRDWGALCTLTSTERAEVTKLWDELEV